MQEENCGCGCDTAGAEAGQAQCGSEAAQATEDDFPTGELVDKRVQLLISAGAAIAANCEPCLKKLVSLLRNAGVCERDIQAAVKVGQFVKEKPAERMKALADELTGTHMLKKPLVDTCPGEG